jgi:hypothetical protein
MTTQPAQIEQSGLAWQRFWSDLRDPSRCIGGPGFDALLFWGCPLLAMLFVASWLGLASLLPTAQELSVTGYLGFLSAVLTYAHLVAVVPRAYGNAEVFAAHRIKLIVVPIVLLAALLISPVCFVIGAVLTVFWDVHHSAMQNFGLARIYDLRAGNPAAQLRGSDMRLNWMLYVGPLAAGAALPFHLSALGQFGEIGWSQIAGLPGVLEGELSLITGLAIAGWLAAIGWSVSDYAKAMRSGYRLPAHKLAMILSSGLVSLIAWGFCSPAFALAAINIYHALQYFALVWLKEGRNLQRLTDLPARRALDVFLVVCALAALGYQFAAQAGIQWLLAPFIGCSLLHFWLDGFVWSVRKRQV